LLDLSAVHRGLVYVVAAVLRRDVFSVADSELQVPRTSFCRWRALYMS